LTAFAGPVQAYSICITVSIELAVFRIQNPKAEASAIVAQIKICPTSGGN
jgi:hypothetical protein